METNTMGIESLSLNETVEAIPFESSSILISTINTVGITQNSIVNEAESSQSQKSKAIQPSIEDTPLSSETRFTKAGDIIDVKFGKMADGKNSENSELSTSVLKHDGLSITGKPYLRVPPGLTKEFNTSYINATIQFLMGSKVFENYFSGFLFETILKNPVATMLHEVVTKMVNAESKSVIDMSQFIYQLFLSGNGDASSFLSGTHQEQEITCFLKNFLQHTLQITSSSLQGNRMGVEPALERLREAFTLVMDAEHPCDDCLSNSNRRFHAIVLNLAIPHLDQVGADPTWTLNDLMHARMTSTIIGNYECAENLSHQTSHLGAEHILNLPLYIIITIERETCEIDPTHRNGSYVPTEKTLDMRDFLHPCAQEAAATAGLEPIYDLVSVIRHAHCDTFSMHDGYYYTVRRSSDDGKWRSFRNESVRIMLDTPSLADGADDCVLMYQRRDNEAVKIMDFVAHTPMELYIVPECGNAVEKDLMRWATYKWFERHNSLEWNVKFEDELEKLLSSVRGTAPRLPVAAATTIIHEMCEYKTETLPTDQSPTARDGIILKYALRRCKDPAKTGPLGYDGWIERSKAEVRKFEAQVGLMR
jgi:hypothetical protein